MLHALEKYIIGYPDFDCSWPVFRITVCANVFFLLNLVGKFLILIVGLFLVVRTQKCMYMQAFFVLQVINTEQNRLNGKQLAIFYQVPCAP